MDDFLQFPENSEYILSNEDTDPADVEELNFDDDQYRDQEDYNE